MKSVKGKLLFTLIAMLCISIICSVACFFVNKVDTANAQSFSYTGTLKQKYNLNQTVTIPTAKLNGVDATYRVVLPNGSYTNAESFEVTVPGFYAVEYSAVVDGILYTDTRSFLVNGELFTVNGAGSYEYTTYDTNYGEMSGLLFNVKSGDTIVYNDVVDLKAINGPKSSIYRMSMNSEKPGDAEITRYEVTITDAYDPSIFITVRVKQSPGNDSNKFSIAYWDASFNDVGNFIGFSGRSDDGKYSVSNLQGIYDDAGNPILSGKFNGYLNEERWGAACMHSFTGGTQESPTNNGSWWGGVAFDVDTNVIYCMTGRGGSVMYRQVIADLNNADIYGEKFPGFTDGKVKVSIKPTSFAKGSANLFISHMGDAQITERGSQEYISPFEPEINVDFGEYSATNVPKVKKGNTYKVFPATAYDIFDGAIAVDTKVYFGYYSSKKVQCDLTDGVFTANRLGTYTIVYNAVNSSGKTDTVLVDVQSIASTEKLDINITNEVDYTQPVLAGTPVKLFDDFTFVNQVSNVAYTFTATHKTQPNVSFELTLDNDFTFIPTVKGEYEVAYTISDYSEKQVITNILTVNESDKIYYVLESNFPKYLIKNGTYKIDFIKAYTLDTGVPVEQNVKLAIDVDGNVLDLYDDLLIVTDGIDTTVGSDDIINNSNKVKLLISPDVQGLSAEDYYVVEIPVIDTGLNTLDALDMSKYLVADKGVFNFTRQPVGIDAQIQSFNSAGEAQFSWINTVSAKPFKLEIEPCVAGDTFKPFDEMNVYIYDFSDFDKFVKVSLLHNSDGWFTNYNDGKMYKIANEWGGPDDQFVFDFYANTQSIKAYRSFAWSGITYYGTDELVDYSNGCLMSIEIKGSTGCDGIRLISINGTQVSDTNVDLAPFYIETLHDNNAGEKNIGDIITIPVYKSFDLLTPYVETRVTVQYRTEGAKKFETVVSKDNVSLSSVLSDREYQFEITGFGTYKVSVEVYDLYNYNNDNAYSYQILVVDNIKPEVVITSASTSASVGSNLTIPKFTVSNKDDFKWYVTVKEPNSIMHYVDDVKSFKFTSAGKHTVTLVVYDANYNTTRVTYTVVVK